MASQSQHPPDRRRVVRLVAFVLVGLYALLFVVLNTAEVEISFVFFSATVSLIVALVLAGLLGAILGWLARGR